MSRGYAETGWGYEDEPVYVEQVVDYYSEPEPVAVVDNSRAYAKSGIGYEFDAPAPITNESHSDGVTIAQVKANPSTYGSGAGVPIGVKDTVANTVKGGGVVVNVANVSWEKKLQDFQTNPDAGFTEIARAQNVYNAKVAAGDTAGAEAAHHWANQIRDALGVSNMFERETGAPLWDKIAATAVNSNPVINYYAQEGTSPQAIAGATIENIKDGSSVADGSKSAVPLVTSGGGQPGSNVYYLQTAPDAVDPGKTLNGATLVAGNLLDTATGFLGWGTGMVTKYGNWLAGAILLIALSKVFSFRHGGRA